MGLSLTESIMSGTRFRWFPLLMLVLSPALVLAFWNWPSEERDPGTRFFICFSIVGATIILLALWLLLFSGLRWAARLGLFMGILAAATGAIWATEFEIEFDGQMNPQFHIGRRTAQRLRLESHRTGAPSSGETPLAATTDTDFPEYRNLRRDGVVYGLQLQRDWSAHPPKELWRQPCGGGYSGFVSVGDLIVTIEQRGDDEAVVAYDVSTGRERWIEKYPAHFKEPLGGNGPRSTPTIAGDAVYVVGAGGKFLCLEAASGKRRWEVDLLVDNANIAWGQCCSPLVVEHLVIVSPGAQTEAAKGKAVRAYDRASGKLVWATGDRRAGYSSPQLSTIAGALQIVLMDGEAVAGFDPKTGRELWVFPWPTYQDIKVAQPIVFDDGRVFISVGYGHGCKMLNVTQQNGVWSVQEMWANTKLRCKFSSPVHHDGHIYGLDEAHLVCINAKDGRLTWKGNRYGFGQILLCGDVIVVGAENGKLALVDATPNEFRETAIIQALPGNKNWNHLAIARGRALLRNHFEMVCYELPAGR